MCENVLIITYFANRRSLIFITWRKDKRRTAPSFSLLHSMLHFPVFLVKNSTTPLLRFAENLTKVKTQTVTFASCFAQKKLRHTKYEVCICADSFMRAVCSSFVSKKVL